jgi:predicted TIM-barrel fold metal-dependent hydrolase
VKPKVPIIARPTTLSAQLDRRDLLRAGLGAGLGLGLAAAGLGSGCGSAAGPQVIDDASTPDQMAPRPDMEPPTPDQGAPSPDLLAPDSAPLPPLPRTFQGYKGLADLPFFELDADGRLRCTVKDLPPTIDFHTHVGFRFLTAPKIDYLSTLPWSRYLIDQVDGEPPFTLDLDAYLNSSATKKMRTQLDLSLASANTVGSPVCKAHTMTNLLAEMDRMGVERAVILPLVLNFPFGDDAPNDILDAYDKLDAARKQRLVIFGCVHPKKKKPLDALDAQIKRGIRGLKVHPTMQRIYPDDAGWSPIYAACEQANIPVLWHGGRTGLEPNFTAKFAEGSRYAAPLAQFPKLRFIMGHCGAIQDWQAAVALGKKHPNLYFDIASQGITVLEQILKEISPQRVLFGTDWPFYPEATALAKVLIMTRQDSGLRRQLLRDTALTLLSS